MPALNVILLVGNLTRDPEVRYSPTGTPVATLGFAVNTRVKGQDGQWREDPCFVDVVFGTQAEACAEYLTKGDPALVEGRLQYRTWEDAHGHRRSKHEVLASRVQFIPRPGPRTASEPNPNPGDPPRALTMTTGPADPLGPSPRLPLHRGTFLITAPGTRPDALEDPQR